MLARQLSPLFAQRTDSLSIPSALGTGDGIDHILVRRIFSSPLPSVVFRQQNGLDKFVQLVQVDIAEDWTAYPSYNVAKKVVEFEYQEEIPRHRLRAAYGDGFKGAPLRCQVSGEGVFPQDTGMCDGQATQAFAASPQEVPVVGGSRHV